jgi:hypothetical protein
MQIPSPNYQQRERLFDEVFQSGVAPYRETVVLDLYRLVTGRQLDAIKPYFATDSPYRGTYSGASGLFTADKPDTTSAEVLGTLGFERAPSPSYLIRYGFSGDAAMLDRVQHPGFQQEFAQATDIAKHEFSQDCRYYLESHGMLSDSQALAWPSVSGARVGVSGLTYMVLPPFSGALQLRDYDRVA